MVKSMWNLVPINVLPSHFEGNPAVKAKKEPTPKA